MNSYQSGKPVEYGLYVSPKNLDFRFVHGDNENLEGIKGAHYFKLPTPLAIVLAPILGGIFVMTFPLIIVGSVFFALLKSFYSKLTSLFVTGAIFLLMFLGSPQVSWAAEEAKQEESKLSNDECLGCHSGMDEKLKFQDGSEVSLLIQESEWKASAHGGSLNCVDCHQNMSEAPHKTETHQSARKFTLALNKACSNCHDEIEKTYTQSIHGKALIEEKNQDVPICTDCHGAHSVRGPSRDAFHENSYKICAKCHGDKAKMKKYNLNTEVLDTYLDDFHGASNRMYSMGAGKPGRAIATCADCHGIHDIQSMKAGSSANQGSVDGGATKVAREQVVKRCQKCHEGTTPAFADGWLSHYQSTIEHAPLVWAVKWFYKVVIPLILFALILHIVLHLWNTRRHK